jgi:hypothetical protein
MYNYLLLFIFLIEQQYQWFTAYRRAIEPWAKRSFQAAENSVCGSKQKSQACDLWRVEGRRL